MRREHGFTVMEVLVVMIIALLILSATLETFGGLVRNSDQTNRRNAAAETARNALDDEVRLVRNLAQRIASPVIDRAGATDLIFQTSEPSRTWVRYCLDTSRGDEHGRLWQATQAIPDGVWAPLAAAQRGPCPGTGWTTRLVVADAVVNLAGGAQRPLFAYACSDGGSACAGDAAGFDRIVLVSATLYVDVDVDRAPPAVRVASRAYLRNQNQAPTAALQATPAGPRTIMLNGSGSADPEGRTLDYFWFAGAPPQAADIDCARVTATESGASLWGATLIGRGILVTYRFPPSAGAAGAPALVDLVVCDPGERSAIAGPEAVMIP